MIKITGKPVITVTDKVYSASVPVASFDDAGWLTAQTELIVTGTDSQDLAEDILAKLKPMGADWKDKLDKEEVINAKLDGLVGKEIK